MISKNFYTISPNLSGILSDDQLYFEGISRPAEIYSIRDHQDFSDATLDVMEKYFNDIYNLFLRKLSSFVAFERVTDEDVTKLQALLQELIKVKGLIEGATAYQKKDIPDKNLL